MPRISINVTLAEFQVAVARYVTEMCEIEVNAGSLRFSYEHGKVIGATYDLARWPSGVEFPPSGPAGDAAEDEDDASPPLFSLTSHKTKKEIVRGDERKVVLGIRPGASSAHARAGEWMPVAGIGEALDLKTSRGKPIYRLERIS